MNLARFFRALEFAADKHRTQRRKSSGDIPYINHPINVACLLAEVGGIEDEEILIAAILHDTIEDTATTSEEIRSIFGQQVESLVAEMTDDNRLPKAERKLMQIAHAPDLSRGAATIKLADKISNVSDLRLSPPVGWSPDRIRQYLDWAEAVVSKLPRVNEPLEKKFAEVLALGRQAWPSPEDCV